MSKIINAEELSEIEFLRTIYKNHPFTMDESLVQYRIDKMTELNEVLKIIDQNANPDWQILTDINCSHDVPAIQVVLVTLTGTHVFRWYNHEWHTYIDTCEEAQRLNTRVNHFFNHVMKIEPNLEDTLIFTKQKNKVLTIPKDCTNIKIKNHREIEDYIIKLAAAEKSLSKPLINREEIWSLFFYLEKELLSNHGNNPSFEMSEEILLRTIEEWGALNQDKSIDAAEMLTIFEGETDPEVLNFFKGKEIRMKGSIKRR